MEKYVNYIESASKIKVHLKHEWESLEIRLDYLKGEIQTYNDYEKTSVTLLKDACKQVAKIVKNGVIENNESIYVDNLFADLFESYFNVLSKIKEIKNVNSLDYNYVFDLSYVTIANIRALIKNVDAFIEMIFNPIIVPDGVRIKDDRIEITLTSIKNLHFEELTEKPKNYKPLFFLSIFGFPTYVTIILSLVTLIVTVGFIFADFYAKSRQIVYLQQESMELYNSALKQLTLDFITSVDTNFIVVITRSLLCVCPILLIAYIIAGKIVQSRLTSKEDLTLEEKYLLAFIHIDKGINLFKQSYEKHKILIIDCAEEGSVDANIRLGELYEKGYFEGKHRKKPSQESLEEALRCYKRAFPNKLAVKKYNKLEEKLAVK